MDVIDLSNFTDFSNLTPSQREFQLINLTLQLASHLEEAQEEIAKLKERQLKLALRIQAVENSSLTSN